MDYAGFQIPPLQLGDETQPTPWTAYNLRNAPAPQFNGLTEPTLGQSAPYAQDPNLSLLGGQQLQMPNIKPTDMSGKMSTGQKMGIASMAGDTLGGMMGGNAAQGIGETMQQFQPLLAQTAARAQQQAAQGDSQFQQMLQAAAQRAASQRSPGMYGGFYPGLAPESLPGSNVPEGA